MTGVEGGHGEFEARAGALMSVVMPAQVGIQYPTGAGGHPDCSSARTMTAPAHARASFRTPHL
jgi:hypothetical protein